MRITGNIGKKLRDGMEKYIPRKFLSSYRIIRGGSNTNVAKL